MPHTPRLSSSEFSDNHNSDNKHISRYDHGTCSQITILPISHLPEFTPEHSLIDLAHNIIAATTIYDGDIIVITSKIISKIEGRIITIPDDPTRRAEFKRQLVLDEAIRIVAQTHNTVITENHLGIVQAASGIDGSNIASNQLLLLPLDPDHSARIIKSTIDNELGITVAIIISDTMGRAWRRGQTDAAIGCAGISSSHPYFGHVDSFGNPLIVTDIAIIDELSAAADLVKGKTHGIPAAIVRGYPFTPNNNANAKELIRDSHEDLFSWGTAESRKKGHQEAILLRRSIRKFTHTPVPEEILKTAVQQALTAPAPHHSAPVVFIHVTQQRSTLLDALQRAWEENLYSDNHTPEQVKNTIHKGNILRTAPEVIIPMLTMEGAHSYPDELRTHSENTMFLLAAGAAVGSLLIALASFDVGSCWIGSTIFAPKITTECLGVPEHWIPLGAIAVGYPAEKITPRPPADISHRWLTR